jgi:hypothetical protein
MTFPLGHTLWVNVPTTTVHHMVAGQVLAVQSAGWWNATRVLAIANIVLAVAAVATASVGVMTIKSSNKVAEHAATQA